ncbi:nickel pincer cofactor biosynthesis protein LarB [Streptomyces sp. NPDC051776]|uniref:nickel pincer cofactor biosynthesis protein LarB n=1 Tax=Streptomyces sp. NPDC051776 TaxID=3155414 RepID=UPI00341DEC91
MPERLLSDSQIRIDHGRLQRTGVAEAVYAPGKTPQQCALAVADLFAGSDEGPVILSRADPDQAQAAASHNTGAAELVLDSGPAGLRTLVWRPRPSRAGAALVLTAGTGDLVVARESAVVLEAYGYAPNIVADVGVAGLHRVLAQQEVIASADIVIVVAGMEGALASVVTGMTRAPVIAVPTSTGYGVSLDGVTALLAMLASCSPGITVVGIDNGFGAGCAAVRFLSGMRGQQ